MEDFENTAAFSRKYQAAQECMCDTEHMFHCPINDYDATDLEDSIMNELVVPDHHKNLVAKKFHSKKVYKALLILNFSFNFFSSRATRSYRGINCQSRQKKD